MSQMYDAFENYYTSLQDARFVKITLTVSRLNSQNQFILIIHQQDYEL